MKVTLATFNTFGAPFFAKDVTKRYKKMAALLNESTIDIVCLQEIATYYHLFLLKKYLTKYPYLYKKNYVYGPQGGLVIASRVPLEDISYTKFTALGSLRNISFYTQLIKNGILTAKYKGENIFFVNTHLVTDMEFEWSPQNHLYHHVKGQVTELASYIQQHFEKEETVFIMGDFNFKKHSQLYNYFLKKTQTIDLFGKEKTATYYRDRLNYRFKGKTSERIDFIFHKKGKSKMIITNRSHFFTKEEILLNGNKSYLSDHIGLKIDFDIV